MIKVKKLRINLGDSAELSSRRYKYIRRVFYEMDAKSTEHRNNKTSKIFNGMVLNICIHTFITIRSCIDTIIDWVFSLVWEGSKKELPALEKRHNILTLSAVELAAKIRNKELKSEELVKMVGERIRIVNPIINAVVDDRIDAAIEEAKEIDRKIEAGLPEEYFKQKPFLGVPFTAKESHAVQGLKHTLGLLCRKDLKADEDAECVRLMKEAGAIAIAVTNVPEANKWQEARNYVYGQTNNPYHLGRTAGGSSGGEAALAAAFGTPIALCSDIGGSTRMPAFYCGLFGYNPTPGYTSLKGSLLRSGLEPTMAAIGFVSRHCADLAPLTKVVAGEKAAELHLDDPVDIKKLKYYYCESSKELRVSQISADLRRVMSDAVLHLTSVSECTSLAPEKYSHEGMRHMFALWRHAMTLESDNFARIITNNKGEAKAFTELGKKLLGQSEYTLAAIYMLFSEQVLPPVNKDWAEKLIQEFKDDLHSKLGDNGVLLFPSAPAPAPYHCSCFLRPYNFAYWAGLNMLGVPSVQVPLGVNSSGLPLGIQVAAARGRDALCVAVARELQHAFGGFVPPCRVLS